MWRLNLWILMALPFVIVDSIYANDAPELQLATSFDQETNINEFLVSEKLDGVRGRWTGEQMLTRSGRKISLPNWFTRDWPEQPLDGELWLGRGKFSRISALVRRQQSDEKSWQKVRFMVFDLPDSSLPFQQRYQVITRLLASQTYVRPVVQFRVESHQALQQLLNERVAMGAEGLMLHHQDALYANGRQQDLMKLKPVYDAEAEVIAHLPGKGKFAGMMGALTVRMTDGRQFNIGTGFSLADRQSPPAIGSIITFTYNGLTSKGLPRFASFQRVRLIE